MIRFCLGWVTRSPPVLQKQAQRRQANAQCAGSHCPAQSNRFRGKAILAPAHGSGTHDPDDPCAGERSHPDVIKGSRRRRIALGSGTEVQDVNRLLKQFMQMQKMMKKMSKGGMSKMLRGLKGRMPFPMP